MDRPLYSRRPGRRKEATYVIGGRISSDPRRGASKLRASAPPSSCAAAKTSSPPRRLCRFKGPISPSPYDAETFAEKHGGGGPPPADSRRIRGTAGRDRRDKRAQAGAGASHANPDRGGGGRSAGPAKDNANLAGPQPTAPVDLLPARIVSTAGGSRPPSRGWFGRAAFGGFRAGPGVALCQGSTAPSSPRGRGASGGVRRPRRS